MEDVVHRMEEVVVYFVVRPIVFALIVSLVGYWDGMAVYTLVDIVLVDLGLVGGLAPAGHDQVVDLGLVVGLALVGHDQVAALVPAGLAVDEEDNNLVAQEEEEHHTHSNYNPAAAAQT